MYYEMKEMREVQIPWPKDQLIVGILDSEELQHDNGKLYSFPASAIEELLHIHDSRTLNKLDSYYGCCFGIVHLLSETNDDVKALPLGFYYRADLILFVCDEASLRQDLRDLLHKMHPETRSMERILTSVLAHVIRNQQEHLHQLEDEIEAMDQLVMDNHIEHINMRISRVRKQILYLTHYFEQLSDVCEELLEDENDFFQEENVHHLRILNDRISRMAGNVRLLRDYVVQVREGYQSQVDINLNQIMYVFTVVTTIFLPLTLIVGWYGMNFAMPELHWKYGYLFVIGLSISIVTLCIWFFKKKRLFRK